MDCFASLIMFIILYIYGIPQSEKSRHFLPFPFKTQPILSISLLSGSGFHCAGKVVRVMMFARKCRDKKSKFAVEVYSLRLKAWRSSS